MFVCIRDALIGKKVILHIPDRVSVREKFKNARQNTLESLIFKYTHNCMCMLIKLAVLV